MKLRKLIAGMVVGFAATGAAFALPVASSAWTSGVNNTLSDDFAETLFDRDLSGTLTSGDVLFSWLKITSYGPSGVSGGAVNELTILSAVQIDTVTALPSIACGVAFVSPSTDGCAGFSFVRPDAGYGGLAGILAFQGLNGLFSNTKPLTIGANSVAVVIEDSTPNFSLASPATAADGALRMVLDLNAGDTWGAVGPVNLTDFFANPVGEGIGSFSMNLTISGQDVPGWDTGTRLTGRGNLSLQELTPGVFGPGGDASFTFKPTAVPEPGTLALLSVGLLGAAVAQRRKQKQ